MGIDITIKDNSGDVLRELAQKERAVLDAWGQQGTSHAKQSITAAGRVDTGAMLNSVTHQVEEGEDAVYVGTNSEYAIFHELGTGIHLEGGGGRQTPWVYKDAKGQWHTTQGVTPIHFIKNAIANHVDEFKAIAERILKG